MTWTGPPPPLPPGPGRARRRPWRLLTAGVVLLVLGVLGGTVAVVLGARGIGASFDVRESLAAEVAVPGRTVAELPAGDYSVVLLGRGLVDGPGSPTAEVDLVGPDGLAAVVTDPGSTSTVSLNGDDAVLVGQVTLRQAGRWSVAAADPGAGVSTLGLRAGTSSLVSPGSVVGLVLGLLGGGLVALIGLVLTIVGAVRRSRAR